MINAPVLHVNGDYPEGTRVTLRQELSLIVCFVEDVARALDTAFQYRNAFRKVSG